MECKPEEFGLSLFGEGSDSYKKTVITLVHSFIFDNGTVSEPRVQFEVGNQHHIPKSDIKAALVALKSPKGFRALHVWRSRSGRTLLKVRPSTSYDAWVS